MIKHRTPNKIISASQASVATGRHLIGPPPEAQQESCQPKLELRRVNQQVVGIEVTCGCGEKLYIECQYEDQ